MHGEISSVYILVQHTLHRAMRLLYLRALSINNILINFPENISYLHVKALNCFMPKSIFMPTVSQLEICL